ncbi:MAG TPA: RNA polymerase-binding protein DksA [Bdellovibrionota bacterium]|nr:RNA polymerase-binding protein DksA [Bdellovibrionota bacterium]
MTKKKLDMFRGIITGRMNELVKQARASLGDLTEAQENYADMTDQASAEIDRNFLLRIKDRERKLILKMKEALERIDDGSFGVCEICGEGIDEERLKARPVTTQCIECKTEMEEQERRMEA